MTPGCTHDSVAHALSAFGDYIESGDVPYEFWVAGDEAYKCTEYVITPFPHSQVQRLSFEEAFNFFQSSHRIHVEQAFGVIIRRWEMLEVGLNFNLKNTTPIIKTIFLLHNFCCEESEFTARKPASLAEWRIDECWEEWVEQAQEAFHELTNDGFSPINTELSYKRDFMVQTLRDREIIRPGIH